MRSVLCLHETVCAGAADGYGRMAGKPAATLLHLGVGPGTRWRTCTTRAAPAPRCQPGGGDVHLDQGKRSDPEHGHRGPGEDGVCLHQDDPRGGAIASDVRRYRGGLPRLNRGRGRECRDPIVPHDLAFEREVREPSSAPSSPSGASALRTRGSGPSGRVRRGAEEAGGWPASTRRRRCFEVGKLREGREDRRRVRGQAVLRVPFTRLDRGVAHPMPLGSPTFPKSENPLALPPHNPGIRPPLPPTPLYLEMRMRSAVREFSKYDVVLIVDVKKPVAMFGYEKGPVDLIPLPEESVWEIDRGSDDAAIDLLYREVGAERIRPG